MKSKALGMWLGRPCERSYLLPQFGQCRGLAAREAGDCEVAGILQSFDSLRKVRKARAAGGLQV